MNENLRGGLTLLFLVACIPTGLFARRRFINHMHGRRWKTGQRVAYSSICAAFFAPGCLGLDTHAGTFPVPLPAMLALLGGSFWGGLIPLVGTALYVFKRTELRAEHAWTTDTDRAD